jgi:hypothetical protein
VVFRTFSALFKIFLGYQGRRVPLRFTLAPGYYISRLWRFTLVLLALIFRTFGASRFPWLLYFARLALYSDFLCKAALPFLCLFVAHSYYLTLRHSTFIIMTRSGVSGHKEYLYEEEIDR